MLKWDTIVTENSRLGGNDLKGEPELEHYSLGGSSCKEYGAGF